jgi:hypothetical protein
MGEPTKYKVPPPETVQELAKLARCAFTLETREDGSEYWTHNRCAPEWIDELTREAHGGTGPGGMLSDDYRYKFIVHALDALEEAEDVDEAGQDWEFEPYLARLADWLGSHNHRFEYCDDWAEERGEPEDTYHRLAGGHLQERLEVLNLVRGSLEAQLQAMAAA